MLVADSCGEARVTAEIDGATVGGGSARRRGQAVIVRAQGRRRFHDPADRQLRRARRVRVIRPS
jgi:hypothetical protein